MSETNFACVVARAETHSSWLAEATWVSKSTSWSAPFIGVEGHDTGLLGGLDQSLVEVADSLRRLFDRRKVRGKAGMSRLLSVVVTMGMSFAGVEVRLQR